MGSDNESAEPVDIDPLQGVEEDVVEAWAKGIDGIVEALDLPEGEEVPSFDGFFEYRDSVLASHKGEISQDPQWWREQIVRDWFTIQSRVKLQMEQERMRQMGIVVESPVESLHDTFNSLRVISIEQFMLESNAGQFREVHFYCDKGRKWLKNVKQSLASYGFEVVGKIDVDNLQYLEVKQIV